MNHSMYSKGDTIKLKNGLIVLVLNNGTMGIEFCREHNKERVNVFGSMTGIGFFKHNIDEGFARSGILDPGKEQVYYPILIGDQKGWITQLALSKWTQ